MDRDIRLYRCYFIKANGAPIGWRVFESESERNAQDNALGLFACYPGADDLEVWEGARLTLSYRRSMVSTPAELRRLCALSVAVARKEPNLAVKETIVLRAAELAQEAEALERRPSPNGGGMNVRPKRDQSPGL